jgi:hypothetical protein
MSDKKETAVSWLVEQLPQIQQQGLRDIWEQAKELEKQQVIDAFENGQDNIDSDGCHIDMNGAEKYYSETYEQ